MHAKTNKYNENNVLPNFLQYYRWEEKHCISKYVQNRASTHKMPKLSITSAKQRNPIVNAESNYIEETDKVKVNGQT